MADRVTLRAMTKSLYDAQKIRIQTGNRLVANVRVRLGQAPGTKTENMPEEGQELLEQLMAEYKRITDALTDISVQKKVAAIARHQGIIADVFEYDLTGHYVQLLTNEEGLRASITKLVQTFPIWEHFLKGVRGCGPLMAAVLISELDPHEAPHVSSFWKYAGLDVAPDGKGRSRREEHLVEVTYTNKKGEVVTRKSITFNPFLKTKLLGVLATNFLRLGSPYREFYDNYKHRLETGPQYADLTKSHKHNRAMRYMIKMFLKDLWVAMRQVEGLPVEPDYAEAKLGLRHTA